ncbi:MAG TPA: hypothetical protein VLU46_15835, partial [Thermoanaerobaculia bacterium]|nr:hypothetical protein [Thermoanaerobaculia bacterium]
MPRVSRLLLVLSCVLLLAAKQRAVRVTDPLPRPDVFSFSEPGKVVVRHVAFDLTIDPATRQISGNETLDIENVAATDRLVLDISGIDVHSV